MTLLEAIFLVPQMSENTCIYCKRPFHQASEAKFVQLDSDFRIPAEVTADGFEYFLEKDGIEELLGYANGKLKSRESKTELIAYYADFDAYPAWFNELCSDA
jgi:hypothetical protein